MTMEWTVPIAVSSAGWTAIGAVGGALVGATAGGLVDWSIAERREQGLARTGARLVAADLRKADVMLGQMVKGGKWDRIQKLPTAGWGEYRAALAGRLGRSDFQVVTGSITALGSLNNLIPERPDFTGSHEVELEPETVKVIEDQRESMAKAYNALADLGDLDQVGARITQRSKPQSTPEAG
jgi:hypothetical protein